MHGSAVPKWDDIKQLCDKAEMKCHNCTGPWRGLFYPHRRKVLGAAQTLHPQSDVNRGQSSWDEENGQTPSKAVLAGRRRALQLKLWMEMGVKWSTQTTQHVSAQKKKTWFEMAPHSHLLPSSWPFGICWGQAVCSDFWSIKFAFARLSCCPWISDGGACSCLPPPFQDPHTACGPVSVVDKRIQICDNYSYYYRKNVACP